MPDYLPTDVVYNIVSFFPNDRATLRACSHVCWTFKDPSQELLFSCITLTNLRITQLRNISSSPRLSAHVRTIAFTSPDWGLSLDTIRELLSKLPNIRTLMFSLGSRITYFMPVLIELQPQMKVEHIENESCKGLPLKLLRIYPHLRRLALPDADIVGLTEAVLSLQASPAARHDTVLPQTQSSPRPKLQVLTGRDYMVRTGEKPLSHYLFPWLSHSSSSLDISELQHFDWQCHNSRDWNILLNFMLSLSHTLRSLVLHIDSGTLHFAAETRHISLATFSRLRFLDFRLAFGTGRDRVIQLQNFVFQITSTLPKSNHLEIIEITIQLHPLCPDSIHQDAWESLDSLLSQTRFAHLVEVQIHLTLEHAVRTQKLLDFVGRATQSLFACFCQMGERGKIRIFGDVD
ncbi:hypothetical protein BDN72DRAFT_281619 [Pluteus cervinus]|uniref:Uncharacterized protein n=1 Tax=Pluteus cervinus TaxID=181527 RepID=A0ACD3B422_9AGAR|nr:hypothetical protein BDN72DRAFT_281619 [Pluteus cervinus]